MKYTIYKIQIKDYIYIGSTKNFTIRKSRHKRDCNIGCEFLVYKTIRENGCWDDCTMVPVKEIEVETIQQARIEEEATRIEYFANMNMVRAYVSKEELKEYKRQYRLANPNKEYHHQHNLTDESKEKNRNRDKTEERKEYHRKSYLAKKAKTLAENNVPL